MATPHHRASRPKKKMPVGSPAFSGRAEVQRNDVATIEFACAYPGAVGALWRIIITAAAATIVARSTLRLHMRTSCGYWIDASKLPGTERPHCQRGAPARVGQCLPHMSD